MPDDVMVNPNTPPPVWSGELTKLLKAELRRRSSAIRGRVAKGTDGLDVIDHHRPIGRRCPDERAIGHDLLAASDRKVLDKVERLVEIKGGVAVSVP